MSPKLCLKLLNFSRKDLPFCENVVVPENCKKLHAIFYIITQLFAQSSRNFGAQKVATFCEKGLAATIFSGF
jgi:hypothetical protein